VNLNTSCVFIQYIQDDSLRKIPELTILNEAVIYGLERHLGVHLDGHEDNWVTEMLKLILLLMGKQTDAERHVHDVAASIARRIIDISLRQECEVVFEHSALRGLHGKKCRGVMSVDR
jgi:hypothetical protein